MRRSPVPVPDADSISITFHDDDTISDRERALVLEYVPEATLEYRLRDPDCTLFIAVDSRTKVPMGFYWTLIGSERPKMYDKVVVHRHEARMLNGFVPPCFRGRGVFPHLIATAANHLLSQPGVRIVYNVVESLNTASLRSHAKVTYDDTGANLLVKLFGRNLLSVSWLEGSLQVACPMRWRSADICL